MYTETGDFFATAGDVDEWKATMERLSKADRAAIKSAYGAAPQQGGRSSAEEEQCLSAEALSRHAIGAAEGVHLLRVPFAC